MTADLISLLKPKRLTTIVDIGANPINGAPPYKPLLDAGLTNLIGFEPEPEAFANANKNKSPNEHYLPYAIGDGQEHTLYICSAASGMTSLLKPDFNNLGIFDFLSKVTKIKKEEKIKTRKLDDIDEITDFDGLKIDVQGSELMIFQNGREKLKQAVMIQTEVSFITLYENQPTFADIDAELRNQGFVPHCYDAVKRWIIAPMVINNNPRHPMRQLLEADIVYVRNFFKPDSISDEQLQHLCIIAHYCYKSYDLAYRCIWLLMQRGALSSKAGDSYLDIVRKSPRPEV